MSARLINIIPSAIDSTISPFDVSKDIAVVITLVYPRMLPPTIKAKPTSDIALPNPSITVEYIANLASPITVVAA